MAYSVMAASDQAELFEARRTLAADDEMVVDLQAEDARSIVDLPRHFDVSARRRRIAGRMVVDQNERGGRDFERAPDNFPGVDRRVVNGPFCEEFVPEEDVLSIQVEGAELLPGCVGQR